METASPQSGVYQKSIKSGTWYLANTLVQKFLGLVTFFVLARFLLPSDYGVITVAMLIIGLAGQLTSIPFGDALIQRSGHIESFLDPIWTLDVIRTAILAVAIFFFGNSIGTFFNVPPPFVAIIQWSGLLPLLSSLCNARQAYFFKELDFRKIFIRDMASYGTYTCVAIWYAIFVEANAWALFAGYVAQGAVGVLMSYILRPSMPRFSLHVGRLKGLIGYGKWVYGQELLDFMLSQVDKALVGRLLSTGELGIYSKSKDIASTVTSTIGSMFSKIGLPAFSLIQDRLEKVREGFLQSVDILLISSIPVSLLILLEGGAIVSLLLGETWLGIVVPLKIFAFGNLFLTFTRIVNPVLGALGRPDVNFRTTAAQVVISIPLLLFGYHVRGLIGMAVAIVVTWMALLGYVILRARPILQIPKRDFFPAIASGGMACLVTLLLDLLIRSVRQGPFIWTVACAELALLGAAYFSVLFWVSARFGKGPWRTCMALLRELGVISRRPKATAP